MLKNLIDNIKENYFLSYIYLYVAIMPWNLTNGMMGFTTVVLFIWWLIIGRKEGYFKKLKNIFTFKPLMVFMLFLGWSYLSLFWTENYEWSEISLKYYKYYWLMIPVFMTSIDKEAAKNIFYIFIFSLGLYALFSISQALGIIKIDSGSTNDPRGILAYAIVTPYMAIASLSSFFIVLNLTDKRTKTLFSILTIFSLISLFLNHGSAGHLGFLMTIIIIIFLYRKYLFNYKIILTIISTISLGAFILKTTGYMDQTLNELYELKDPNNPKNSGNFSCRVYLWEAAIELIPNHPIIGAGAGDNIDEFIEFTKTHPNKASVLRSYHNQHLDTLTKYGIIGYFLLWGAIFWLLLLLRNNRYYFTLALIFFSVTFFDGIGDIILLMKPYNNIFMLMFLLFSIIAISEQKSEKNYKYS